MKIDTYTLGVTESLVDELKVGVKVTPTNGPSLFRSRAIPTDSEAEANKVIAQLVLEIFKELDLV